MLMFVGTNADTGLELFKNNMKHITIIWCSFQEKKQSCNLNFTGPHFNYWTQEWRLKTTQKLNRNYAFSRGHISGSHQLKKSQINPNLFTIILWHKIGRWGEKLMHFSHELFFFMFSHIMSCFYSNAHGEMHLHMVFICDHMYMIYKWIFLHLKHIVSVLCPFPND